MKERNLDVYVVSWGGVATSYFMKWLQRNNIKVNSASDRDKLKHISSPDNSKLVNVKFKKVIFIYDDVLNSLVSLWRRGYHKAQIYKLSNRKIIISRETTLKQYANKGKDLFKFQQMYENWAKTKKDYDCLFVKGTQMYKYKFQILKFLNLPIDLKFFPFRVRKSNWDSDLDQDLKENLYAIYGEFNEFILSNPDIQLQEKNSLILIDLATS